MRFWNICARTQVALRKVRKKIAATFSILIRQLLPLKAPKRSRIGLVQVFGRGDDAPSSFGDRDRGFPVLGRPHVRLDPSGVHGDKVQVGVLVSEALGGHVDGRLGDPVAGAPFCVVLGDAAQQRADVDHVGTLAARVGLLQKGKERFGHAQDAADVHIDNLK